MYRAPNSQMYSNRTQPSPCRSTFIQFIQFILNIFSVRTLNRRLRVLKSHQISFESLCLISLCTEMNNLFHLLSRPFLLSSLSSPVCPGFLRGRQRSVGWMIEWMGFTLRVHRVESEQALYELVNRADPAVHSWTEYVCAKEVNWQTASQSSLIHTSFSWLVIGQ